MNAFRSRITHFVLVLFLACLPFVYGEEGEVQKGMPKLTKPDGSESGIGGACPCDHPGYTWTTVTNRPWTISDVGGAPPGYNPDEYSKLCLGSEKAAKMTGGTLAEAIVSIWRTIALDTIADVYVKFERVETVVNVIRCEKTGMFSSECVWTVESSTDNKAFSDWVKVDLDNIPLGAVKPRDLQKALDTALKNQNKGVSNTPENSFTSP